MRTSRLRGCLCQCRCYSTSPSSSAAPLDPYNAFTTRFSEQAESSTSASSDNSLSDLRITIKDNFATREGYTSCASKALETYASPYDATVVQLLRQKGAKIVGKTNMDEFGMGSYGVHSHFGEVRNPIDQERVAGGSSSGAAASVTAGLCDVSIGSDTGGSIRLPASFTGTIGFKPSYGLLSRYGLVSYASSLDTVGILAKRVKHVKRVFDTLDVHDSKDPTAIPPSYRRKKSANRDSGKLRIGVPIECFPSELSKQAIAPTRRAIQVLRSMGADIVSVSIPSITRALSAYYTIASSEASSNLAKYDGIRYGFRNEGTHTDTRTAGFGEEVQKRIILGTYALTAEAFDNYFLAAQRLRNELKQDVNKVMRIPNPLRSAQAADSGVDLLIFPSAISHAPTRESVTASQHESSTDSYVQDILTVPASLAGLPALSYPLHIEGMLPVGVQLVSQWGSDDVVLEVASQLEDAVIAGSQPS